MANSQPVVTNPPKDENPLYNKNQIPSDTHTDSVPILTNEKLSIILRAIDEDCNIKYLKRFWNGKPNDAPENKAKQKATIQGVGEN